MVGLQEGGNFPCLCRVCHWAREPPWQLTQWMVLGDSLLCDCKVCRPGPASQAQAGFFWVYTLFRVASGKNKWVESWAYFRLELALHAWLMPLHFYRIKFNRKKRFLWQKSQVRMMEHFNPSMLETAVIGARKKVTRLLISRSYKVRFHPSTHPSRCPLPWGSSFPLCWGNGPVTNLFPLQAWGSESRSWAPMEEGSAWLRVPVILVQGRQNQGDPWTLLATWWALGSAAKLRVGEGRRTGCWPTAAMYVHTYTHNDAFIKSVLFELCILFVLWYLNCVKMKKKSE